MHQTTILQYKISTKAENEVSKRVCGKKPFEIEQLHDLVFG